MGRWDHPRGAGTQPHPLPGAPHQGDIPAGLREHHHIGHGGISGQGIIPACAGNTWTEGLRPGDAGIIPACAGNTLRPSHASSMTGIIPACAGNTPAKAASPSRNRDHPRVCGNIRDGLGSCLHAGIIPACAGNTAYVLSAFSSSRGLSPARRGT